MRCRYRNIIGRDSQTSSTPAPPALGEQSASARLMRAAEAVKGAGALTQDLGGTTASPEDSIKCCQWPDCILFVPPGAGETR